MGFLTPNATGEHDVLTTYAMQQLAQMRTTVVGLTDDQAHATPTASAFNLTGLLLHCGGVAVFWSAAAASAPGAPALPDGLDDLPLAECIADPRPLRDILATFDRYVEVTRENLAAVRDLDTPVPVPSAPWIPADLTSWEARWCLAHISAEIARHTGLAVLIRETLDGKGAYELNALAEAH